MARHGDCIGFPVPFFFFYKEGNNHKGYTKLEVCEYKIRRFWGGWARSPLWKPLTQSGLDFQFPWRPTFTLRETFLSTFYISLCFIWLPKFLSSQGINTFLMFIFLSLTVSTLKIKKPFLKMTNLTDFSDWSASQKDRVQLDQGHNALLQGWWNSRTMTCHCLGGFCF